MSDEVNPAMAAGHRASLIARVSAPLFVYKASQLQFLEAMKRDGCFKVTKLSEFRRIETHGNAIGDPRDGLHTQHVDQFRTGDVLPEEIRVGPIRLTKQARNFFMDGCTITRSAPSNTYIFSVSTYHSSDLLSRYESDAGADRPTYDGFVRIRQPLDFGNALAVQLASVADSDVDWYFHPCIYASSNSSFVEDGNFEANVAIYKEPEYTYQAEWRYVFKLKSKPTVPSFFVYSADAAALVDRLIPRYPITAAQGARHQLPT